MIFRRYPTSSGALGPMASSDFGNDLDIPAVIRNSVISAGDGRRR